MPSHTCPPPLSQPTPSRQPTRSASAQSVPRQNVHEASFYRFPFGTHKGKTLLDVPEKYINFLRVNEDMASSMPEFAAALRVFDAGLPPVALMPPKMLLSSSRTTTQASPSSSTPARLIASQPTMGDASREGPPSSSAPTQYQFDFGIHTGKTLADVPADYIDFLKKRGIVEAKPTLAVAVIKHEREQSAIAQSQPSQAAPGPYTLNFGKWIGRTLDEIPTQYLNWLKTSEIRHERPDLRAAIWEHERVTTMPKSTKRKRTSKSSGNSTSSKRRTAEPKRAIRGRNRRANYPRLLSSYL